MIFKYIRRFNNGYKLNDAVASPGAAAHQRHGARKDAGVGTR